jgi:peptidoglycan/xylan/chitin deacetylase (PgdA/CDA1 family)
MQIAIKIDVDTERGTRIGVPQMLTLFAELKIPATFLFSLGPDNTGRAIKRIFRPGFLKKVRRTNVVGTYGLGTLLNGVLWPGPHVAKRHKAIMQLTKALGHEVGIHCYDHIRWQDGVQKMSAQEVAQEFQKALDEFKNVFGCDAKAAGTAGWQANAHSLTAYDQAHLLYGSDSRGHCPFFPKIGEKVFETLQIPSALPTLDELLGLPEYPLSSLKSFYLSQLKTDQVNILTTHAELEGMVYLDWFKDFCRTALDQGIEFVTMESIAREALADRAKIPVCEFVQGTLPGRSGTLAVQGE